MRELEGQVALISGASGGIGTAIARLFAEAGAKVVLLDINHQAIAELEQTLCAAGYEASAIAADIQQASSVQAAVERSLELYKDLDIVVNAAGLLRAAPITSLSEADWDAVINVNVRGTFLVCKYAVPALRQANNAAIVNLSSVSAFVGSDIGSAYHASKGAVLSLTYALAQELVPIRVNAICPGWVDAGFTHQALEQTDNPEALYAAARANHLLGRMATPLEVAEAALFLASPRASFITGTALNVDGGFMVKR